MDSCYLHVFVSLCLLFGCQGDMYMHNPRGSNNRLNEARAARKNANRLFDSQNNNRGGYNKGDKDSDAAGTNYDKQYHMKYFQSGKDKASNLIMELTNQHGFGVPNKKLISNMVIQCMCQEITVTGKEVQLRDGVQTDRQKFTNGRARDNKEKFESRRTKDTKENLGLHESYENYDRCRKRQRNKGLFLATQTIKRDTATRTRQNPRGTRRGYECPEERDYYPYWHPNPWRDIAVLTSDTEKCQFYQSESFNVKPRHECIQPNIQSSRFNTKEECENKGGAWTEFHNYLEVLQLSETECKSDAEKNKYENLGFEIMWANIYDHDNRKEACIVKLEQPECLKGDFTRVNHLGNTVNLKMLKYNWKIPFFPSGRDHKCVVRFRYNITTADYDPWNTGAESNGKHIANNPEVDIGVANTPLRLAINTAQFGRTFQDRSHVMILKSRSTLPNGVADKVIHNWNVRGKRGNIVQTYPANEYDFTPVKLEINDDELVHVQWTGSNTHNNGRPGGDGQTGDAGEGRAGTDRHNMLPLKDLNFNFPMAMESATGNIFQQCTPVWLSQGDVAKLTKNDVAIQFASSGYFQCQKSEKCQSESMELKDGVSPTLDDAPASFEGAIFQCPAGTYHVVCTRNNNFTNRSQKGTLVVKS